MTNSGHIAVLITAPSVEEANRLSRGLVENKLAYCVNTISGIQSTYFWDGQICVDPEIQLVAKTRNGRFKALESWVQKNHSYEVPEIIALPIIVGSKAYLDCVDNWVPET